MCVYVCIWWTTHGPSTSKRLISDHDENELPLNRVCVAHMVTLSGTNFNSRRRITDNDDSRIAGVSCFWLLRVLGGTNQWQRSNLTPGFVYMRLAPLSSFSVSHRFLASIQTLFRVFAPEIKRLRMVQIRQPTPSNHSNSNPINVLWAMSSWVAHNMLLTYIRRRSKLKLWTVFFSRIVRLCIHASK